MAPCSLLRLVGGVVASLLVSVTPMSAQDTAISVRIDHFQLWNACEPIALLVESPSDDDVKMGLTHKAITTTVRSRLRAARLYRNSRTYLRPQLYVNINTTSRAFSVRLEFNKWVSDPISGQKGRAVTWNVGGVGQGRDADYILSWVSRLTDEFIDDYLRINEAACPRSPIDP